MGFSTRPELRHQLRVQQGRQRKSPNPTRRPKDSHNLCSWPLRYRLQCRLLNSPPQEVVRTNQIDEDPETVTEVPKQLRREKSQPHHPGEGPEAEKEGEVLELKTKEGEYTGLPALERPPREKEARIEIESVGGALHHERRSLKEARRENDTLRSHQSRLFHLPIEEEQITGVHGNPLTHHLRDKVVVGSANCLCRHILGGRPLRTKDK